MAIKGKSKNRGSRAVPRARKPVYVPVKTPLLRRRGLWVGVASVLAAAAIAGLGAGFIKQTNQSREQGKVDRMASAMSEYQGKVEPILSAVGQATPPSSFQAFPQLQTSITQLQGEDVTAATEKDAADAADAVASAAKSAQGRFEDLKAADIVRGHDLPVDFVELVLHAEDGFGLAMRMYRSSAELVSLALDTEPGGTRDRLLTEAKNVNQAATDTMANAYGDYVEAQASAGTFSPNLGGALPGATGSTP